MEEIECPICKKLPNPCYTLCLECFDELQAENAKLKEENRTAASIIKRFLVIAEALKGGCWK